MPLSANLRIASAISSSEEQKTVSSATSAVPIPRFSQIPSSPFSGGIGTSSLRIISVRACLLPHILMPSGAFMTCAFERSIISRASSLRAMQYTISASGNTPSERTSSSVIILTSLPNAFISLATASRICRSFSTEFGEKRRARKMQRISFLFKNASAFSISDAWSISSTFEKGNALRRRPSSMSPRWKFRIRLLPSAIHRFNVSIAFGVRP